MEQAKELEQEGREVRLTRDEITEVLINVQLAISLTYEMLVIKI
jgi:hypothetical protein